MTIDQELEYAKKLKNKKDEKVRAELYEQFEGLLHDVSRSVCFDERDYEDIFQESVLGFMEALDRWDIELGPLTGFVWIYAWGYAINYANRRRHIVSSDESIVTYDGESGTYVEMHSYYTASHEHEIALRSVIDTIFECLSDTERKIFELRYYDGMTAKEIAPIIGKTATNVDTIAWQCKNRIRELFDKESLGL